MNDKYRISVDGKWYAGAERFTTRIVVPVFLEKHLCIYSAWVIINGIDDLTDTLSWIIAALNYKQEPYKEIIIESITDEDGGQPKHWCLKDGDEYDPPTS